MFDQLAQVLIALLLLRWKMSRPTAQSVAPGPSLRPKSPGVWSVGLQVGRWGAQGPGSDETQGLFVTLDMFPVFRMATGWDKLYQAIYIYIYIFIEQAQLQAHRVVSWAAHRHALPLC